MIILLEGDCGSVSCLTANDNSCSPSLAPALEYCLNLFFTDYLIAITAATLPQDSATFTFVFELFTPNGDCQYATPLGNPSSFVSGNNLCSRSFTNCGSSSYPSSVWYTFNSADNNYLLVTMCRNGAAGAEFDATLALHDGCPGVCVTFNDNSCEQNPEIETFISTNQAYYLSVSSANGALGDFEFYFTLFNRASNDLCTTADDITSTSSLVVGTTVSAFLDGVSCDPFSLPNVWYTFTTTSNRAKIVASLCAQGGYSDAPAGISLLRGSSCESSTCFSNNDNTCSSGGSIYSCLPIQSTYYLSVYSATPTNFALFFQIIGYNDQCTTAKAITAGSYYYDSNELCWLSLLPATSCTYATNPNLPAMWYTFNSGTSNNQVVVSFCDGFSNFDVIAQLFTDRK